MTETFFTRLHLVFKTFLRCPADVSFADKRLKHVSQTSSSAKLTKDVFVSKTYKRRLRHQNLQKTSSSPKLTKDVFVTKTYKRRLRHQNLQKTSSSPKRMVHWDRSTGRLEDMLSGRKVDMSAECPHMSFP